jgi:hypothetical protein
MSTTFVGINAWNHGMEPPAGPVAHTTLWIHCMEPLQGAITWWNPYLEPPHGTVKPIHGTTAWRLSMESRQHAVEAIFSPGAKVSDAKATISCLASLIMFFFLLAGAGCWGQIQATNCLAQAKLEATHPISSSIWIICSGAKCWPELDFKRFPFTRGFRDYFWQLYTSDQQEKLLL